MVILNSAPLGTESYKQCMKCGEVKALAEFYRASQNRDRVSNQCKQCKAIDDKAYYEGHKETIITRVRAYEEANRKVVAVRQKAWREKNKESLPAKMKAYYERNKEGILIKCKIYREEHKKAIAAYKKAWHAAHKESLIVKKKAHYEKNKEVYQARRKSYYEANKELITAKNKAYSEAHKEVVVVRKKAWHAAHKEIVVARKKAWGEVHKESLTVKRKAYYEANREVLLVKQKAYFQTPAGRAVKKAVHHKRRNRGQFAFERLATNKDFQHWEERGAVCYLTGVYLLPGTVTGDHVIPLHWGGSSDPWNFLPASRLANSTKQDRLVYFDLATREPRFTLDPCPGGTGPTGETWPRIPLTQPSLDEMQEMVDAWKARCGLVW